MQMDIGLFRNLGGDGRRQADSGRVERCCYDDGFVVFGTTLGPHGPRWANRGFRVSFNATNLFGGGMNYVKSQ